MNPDALTNDLAGLQNTVAYSKQNLIRAYEQCRGVLEVGANTLSSEEMEELKALGSAVAFVVNWQEREFKRHIALQAAQALEKAEQEARKAEDAFNQTIGYKHRWENS